MLHFPSVVINVMVPVGKTPVSREKTSCKLPRGSIITHKGGCFVCRAGSPDAVEMYTTPRTVPRRKQNNFSILRPSKEAPAQGKGESVSSGKQRKTKGREYQENGLQVHLIYTIPR